MKNRKLPKVKKVQPSEKELSPIVKSLKGSFKAPKDFDYKKILVEELSKKYL